MDLNRKVKGKAQQMRGELKIRTGNRMDGTIDKVKGRLNEGIANANNALRDAEE